MKKVLAFVLVLMLLSSCAFAMAEGRVKTPAGQLEGGPEPYFVIKSAFFKSGIDLIVIEQKNSEYFKRYDQPVTINKVDDDFLVPMDSMSKIFQFDYTYDAATGAIHMEDEYVKADMNVGSTDVTINGVAETLATVPVEVEGVLCIPAISVGTKVLDLVTGESLGYTYLSYTETALPAGSTGSSGAISLLTTANKFYGVIEPLYWFEEAQMLMPYRLTVPMNYDPEVPTPLVVYLHGGSGDDNRDIERMRNYHGDSGCYWDMAVDRVGFIALSVNGYCRGDYGTQFNSKDPAKARASELSMLEVLAAIENVKSKYNIDESRMFLMGNSMGGYGTTYIACMNPGMFAAISPSPAFTTSFADPMVLGNTPIRVVSDDGAYHTQKAVVQEWKDKGLNISIRGVPGGVHATAWSQVVDETLDFFASVK